MHIIGDVAGRDCVLVDDMIDTGGTLCKAAEALKRRGANVYLRTRLTQSSLATRRTTCVTL
ncbi:phosphoribosyltransferase family protein [Shigella sonnei]